MIVNDKRENTNTLPIKNIIQGNCFMYNDALYIKTNASDWIEQTNPNDCFCLIIANGRLTKFNKETIVTPVNTECNIITKDEKLTTEEMTPEKSTSKYILMSWTIFDDEIRVRPFNTESEAQKFMETNYNAVLSAEKDNEIEINYDFIGKRSAKIKTDHDIFLWQIEEIKFYMRTV